VADLVGGDVVEGGPARPRRSRQWASWRRPAIAASVGAVVVGVAWAAVEGTEQGASTSAAGRGPGHRLVQIHELNSNSYVVRMAGGVRAQVRADSLRPEGGPATTWLSLDVTGLPRGYHYRVDAGVCRRGRPVHRGRASGLSQAFTSANTVKGRLSISVPGLPIRYVDPHGWLRITRWFDHRDYGGLRGSLSGLVSGEPNLLGPTTNYDDPRVVGPGAARC
jgi:hypothetical protein